MAKETEDTVDKEYKAIADEIGENAGNTNEDLDAAIAKKTPSIGGSSSEILRASTRSSNDDSREDHSVTCRILGKSQKKRSKVLISTYKDYNCVLPEEERILETASFRKSLTAKEPTFTVKLHMILSSPTLASIITWLPHGRSWRILQQREFEEKVIPLYFRHGRFSSFTRQVSGWGFNRITAGADFNSYYHELFLRGKPHLCHQMKRLTPKDTEQRRDSKKTGQVEPLPDFYLMDRNNPLPQIDPNNTLPPLDNWPTSADLCPNSNQFVTNETNSLGGTDAPLHAHNERNALNLKQVAPSQGAAAPMQPLDSNNGLVNNIISLLSLMLSSGQQVQPLQLVALLGLLLSPQASSEVQPQPANNNQLSWNANQHNLTPAPVCSQLSAPQGGLDASTQNLLTQLLQAFQPQQSSPPPPNDQQIANMFIANGSQQSQEHPMARENNTTGQTIANFLHDRSQQQQQQQQQQLSPPPIPAFSPSLASLLQQATQPQPAQSQQSVNSRISPELAALLLSQSGFNVSGK